MNSLEQPKGLLAVESTFWNWVDRHKWFIFLGLVALNLALKGPFLGGSSLFLDEAVAIHDTQGSIAETIEFSASDPTPPLYYLILGIWCKIFGISEASARFPSTIFSALTAGMIFLLGRRHSNAATGFFSALLFSFSNVGLVFAHEARAYALAGLLMTISYHAFLQLREEKSNVWRPLLLLALSNILLLYTHYVTAMGIAAQALMSLWMLKDTCKTWFKYVASQVLVLAVWLPWVVMNQSLIPKSKVTSWLVPATKKMVLDVLSTFAGSGFLPWIGLTVIAGGGLLLFVQLLRGKLDSRQAYSTAVYAAWGLLSLALQVVVSHVFMPIFGLRYALYALPGFFLLLGAIMAQMRMHPLLKYVLFLTYLAVSIWKLDLNPAKPEAWREAAEYIKRLDDGHSGFVVNAYYQFMPFSYYYKPECFKDYNHTMPRLGELNIHLGKDSLIVPRMDDQAITNVILVLSHDELVDPNADLEGYMRRHYCISNRLTVPGIRVLQFRNRPCPQSLDTHREWDFSTLQDNKEAEKFCPDPVLGADNQVTFTKPGADYSAGYSIQAGEILEGNMRSVEVAYRIFAPRTDQNIKFVIVMDHDGESYNWQGIDVKSIPKPNEWTEGSLSITIPKVKDPKDKITMYFWAVGGAEAYFDDLSLDFWD